MSGSLADLGVRISVPLGPLRAGLAQAQKAVSGSASMMGSVLKTALGVATGNVLADGALRGAGGIKAMVQAGIGFNAQLETMRTSFEVMLGSVEKATTVIRDLQKFAAVTPFETGDLSKAAVQLLATKKIAQEQLLPVLKKLGDAAAGSAEGFEALPRITRAVSQMLAKGKVQAEDMLQLAEAGVPAWAALAEKVGMTQRELQELSAAGKLGEKSVLALIDALGDRFAGMADRQSKTFSGLLSTIRDNINITLGAVMVPIFNRMKAAMERVVAVMSSPAFTRIVNQIAAGIDTAIRAVEAGLAKARAGIADMIDQVKFLGENWRMVWDLVKARAAEIGLWVRDKLIYALDVAAPHAIAALWDGALAGAKEFINQFQTMIRAMVNFLADGLTAIFEMWKTRVETMMVAFNAWKTGEDPSKVIGLIGSGEKVAQGQFARDMINAGNRFGGEVSPAVAAIADKIGQAMRNVMQNMPAFRPSPAGQAAAARAAGIFDKLRDAREAHDRRAAMRAGIDKVIGGLFGGADSALGFLKSLFAGPAADGNLFAGGPIIEGGKKKGGAGSAFTGLAEMHSRIQDSINSSESKDRKAMVRGIERGVKVAEEQKGLVKNVGDGVVKMLGAIKELNLGFGP